MLKEKQDRIHSLSALLIDRIAAGEVIEGPSSVIKELIENSIDAKASSIRLETKAAGLEQITLEDDGDGIHPEDLEVSILRHATSKISSLEDIEKLSSFGFRGEALSAIASVSHLEIKSRRQDKKTGALLSYRGGEVLKKSPSNHRQGTTITVSNLFYSTPARRKYIKSPRTENIKNHKEVMRLAMTNPQLSLTYFRENKEFSSYPANQNLYERLELMYGKGLISHLLPVESEYMGIGLSGYISSPEYYRANRDGQFSFINKRPTEVKNLSAIVRKAYGELLGPTSHPYFFLFMEADPSRIDPNVHPQKKEIRLADQSTLYSLVFNTLSKALRPNSVLSLKQADKTHNEKETSLAKIGQLFVPSQNILIQKDLQTSSAYMLDLKEKREQKTKTHCSDSSVLPPSSIRPLPKISSPTKTSLPIEAVAATDQPRSSSTEDKAPQFSFVRHFGTVLGTYVIAEDEKSLYIIDQHTAHERVNYEQNIAKLAKTRDQRQGLLNPLLVECLADELDRIIDAKETLLQNGFLVEAAGPKAYLIREVPPYIDLGTEIEVFTHLIDRVLSAEQVDDNQQELLYKEYAAMRACKASIKKNDQISEELIAEILRSLPKCKEPGRCPHGRPTMFQISLQELDHMFKRS